MITLFLTIFAILILLSAFFSSAETALLSINRIRLSHLARKRNRKAQILCNLLEKPEEFFSAILIGNNLANVAAATVATTLFTILFRSTHTLLLIAETLATTFILLLFSEIIPKSYAFRHPEKLAHLYAFPVSFFKILFYPFIRLFSAISLLIMRAGRSQPGPKKELSPEEIKHFLTHDTVLFQHHPETLRMVNEIIDITRKGLRAIMTPRTSIVALEENAGIDKLKAILADKRFSKVPIYRKRLDNITGVIHPHSLMAALLERDASRLTLKDVASPPIFASEYSSLHYILGEFRRHDLNMAIVLDEYGTTLGLITLNDILRETIGDLKWQETSNIQKLQKNVYCIRGSLPVEEINDDLDWNLPQKKEYTTLSGLFVYHYGKLPSEKARVQLDHYLLIVRRMGKRKIEEVIAIAHETDSR